MKQAGNNRNLKSNIQKNDFIVFVSPQNEKILTNLPTRQRFFTIEKFFFR